MKRIIITVVIIGSAFACKKNTAPKTEAPVKYYFKIEPVELDGSHNTATHYKTEIVY